MAAGSTHDDHDLQPMVGDFVVEGGHRELPPIDSDSFHRDPELRRMLVTFGKLSSHNSPEESRISVSHCSSLLNCY